MSHRTFSKEELAAYLHLSVDSIAEMARQGEIPHAMRGERLVFQQHEIDVWASRRIIGMSGQGLRDYHGKSSRQMHTPDNKGALIPSLILPGFIFPSLASKTKASALKNLVLLADQTGRVASADDLRASLEERERMGSTSLPGGLAIPHPAHHEPYLFVDSFVLVARTAHPIPYGSPLGEMTDLLFLMCCCDAQLHLHLLARLCMMCHHTTLLLRLRETRDPEVMLHALLAAEEEVLAATAKNATPPAK